MLHYLLPHYLKLQCVNVALCYVPLFYYCTAIWFCTLFMLYYLMLRYFNVALCAFDTDLFGVELFNVTFFDDALYQGCPM